MGKKFSSRRHALQKITTKLATYRPSSFFVAAIVMSAAIFLLGGGIYDILMEPVAAIPLGSGRFLSFIPYQIHEQLLLGSIAVMILYALGTTGLLLIYRSTRFVRNPRQVSFLTKIGAAFILVSFVAIELVLYWILNYQQ
jgi:uncharacterized membrane protein